MLDENAFDDDDTYTHIRGSPFSVTFTEPWEEVAPTGAAPAAKERVRAWTKDGKVYVGAMVAGDDEDDPEAGATVENAGVFDVDAKAWSPVRDVKSCLPNEDADAAEMGKALRRLGLPDDFAAKLLAKDQLIESWALDGVGGEPPSARKKFVLKPAAQKLYVYGGGLGDEAYDDLYLLDCAEAHPRSGRASSARRRSRQSRRRRAASPSPAPTRRSLVAVSPGSAASSTSCSRSRSRL